MFFFHLIIKLLNQIVYVDIMREAAYFLEKVALGGIEDPYKRPLGARGGDEPPILGQREARDAGGVRIDKLCLPGTVVLHPDLPSSSPSWSWVEATLLFLFDRAPIPSNAASTMCR
jgi:hypothetical protein